MVKVDALQFEANSIVFSADEFPDLQSITQVLVAWSQVYNDWVGLRAACAKLSGSADLYSFWENSILDLILQVALVQSKRIAILVAVVNAQDWDWMNNN